MTMDRPKQAGWVTSEEQRLRELIKAGKSVGEAAEELKRSVSSVANRARRLGLSFEKKKQFLTTAQRAEEMAAKVIEQRIEADAPAEERASRKRRLLKGPSSFRSVRKDHPE